MVEQYQPSVRPIATRRMPIVQESMSEILPRTTLSFDEFLTYFKQDNTVIDNPAVSPGNFGYILANPTGVGTPTGTPVDLGNIWSTQTAAEALPCAPPIVAGTVNTATPTCNGYYLIASRKSAKFHAHREISLPIELLQEFRDVRICGLQHQQHQIPDFLEDGERIHGAHRRARKTTGGPADTKRVSVNADWSGVYSVTEKLRIRDSFRYDNWRIPGLWDTAETAVFGTPSPGPGVAGLLLSPGVFNSTTCTAAAKYNQATCPQHTASSAADITNEIASTFLGQNLKSNTLEVEYDLTRRYSAHIGYLYTNRTIASMDAVFDVGEFYFPGGPPERRQMIFSRHVVIVPWSPAPCPPVAR